MTLAVSRNLIEMGPDFARPRMDFGNWEPLAVAIEPPIFNGLVAFLHVIFGEHHWFGRLVNLIFSSLGLWFFYAFLKRIWENERAAVFSTVLFAVSICFVYARKAMPDTFALSFVLAGCFFGVDFLQKGGRRSAFLTALFLGIGFICKIPMVCAASLLLIPFLWPTIEKRRKTELIGLGFLALLPALIWYFWWLPHLIEHEKGLVLFETFGLEKGWEMLYGLRKNLWEVLFVEGQLISWLSLGMTLPGLFYLGMNRQTSTFYGLILYTLLFTFFVIQAGYALPTHPYYGIPYTVPMAMMAGYGLAHVFGKWHWLAWVYLFLASFDAIWLQKRDFFARPENKKYLVLEKMVDSVSARSDRFVANAGIFPLMHYFLHRKGTAHYSGDFKEHPDWIADDCLRGGCQFICIDKSQLADSLAYPVLIENADFRIYRFEQKNEQKAAGPKE